MDPFAVLGLAPGATRREAMEAYRRLAKEWHPDRRGDPDAERRMADINAAYDILRAEAWVARRRPAAPERAAGGAPGRHRGAWLPRAIRRALGGELLGVLEPHEHVWLVTPTTTWASPEALLAASDRRLLWLLDDAVVGRVQALRYPAIAGVEQRLRRPRRRVATLRVHGTNGRRVEFGDLRPATALAVARRIEAARAATRGRRARLA